MKTLKLLPVLGLVFISLIFHACQDDQITNQTNLIPVKQIKEKVKSTLERGEMFKWQDQSTAMIYSAGMYSDSVFAVGYQNTSEFVAEKDIQNFKFNAKAWQKVRTELENLILSKERKLRPTLTLENLKPQGDINNFPQIVIHAQDFQTIELLSNHPMVRYVEPMGYYHDPFARIVKRSDSGCNGGPNYNIDPNDFDVIAPNTKMSWHFGQHNVNQAWNTSDGDNVKICIIDTGASFEQDNLGSEFNQGMSSNRTVTKLSTLYSGWWFWRELTSPNDECGHGTGMCGLSTGPRGIDGNSTGVAYNADLLAIKAVEDVIINTSNEKSGVRDALHVAGNSDANIISMSIGTPFYSSTVADGIYYAYNRGKLIFAAAGTSLNWTSWYPVIFPANMTQCNAVTGVKDNDHTIKCETCHQGPEVMFTSPVERLANSNNKIITLALSSNQPRYSGASSGATSTTAGLAALVWSNNPALTRAQLVDKLSQSAEFYNSPHPTLGYGVINVQSALNSN